MKLFLFTILALFVSFSIVLIRLLTYKEKYYRQVRSQAQKAYCFQCEIEMPVLYTKHGEPYCSNCGLKHEVTS